MKRTIGKGGFVWSVIAVVVLASCAPTLLGRAKQSAAVSNSIYESLNPQVVDGITEIVQKDRDGTITPADRERLRSLNELRKGLDDYAAAHNLFVEAIKTWESTGTEPGNAVLLENQILNLINRAITLAGQLGLKLPPGLR